MTFAKNVKNELLNFLAGDSEDTNEALNQALRLLSKWRSVLKNTLLEKGGTYVLQGPLKGMDFVERSSEGCHIAKILGCYEHPLQAHILNALTTNYSKIINIGCAEGYYAVGFAIKMPNIKSLAFDTDPKSQAACRKLAMKNKVDDRVEVGGIFLPEDFAKYADDSVLIFCDIEGAEDELLNPESSPALESMDIIVESHECFRNGITKRLIERFASTHNVQLIEDDGSRQLIDPPVWFTKLSHLDQLLSTWEWRSGPTPWLVMHSKALMSSH